MNDFYLHGLVVGMGINWQLPRIAYTILKTLYIYVVLKKYVWVISISSRHIYFELHFLVFIVLLLKALSIVKIHLKLIKYHAVKTCLQNVVVELSKLPVHLRSHVDSNQLKKTSTLTTMLNFIRIYLIVHLLHIQLFPK